MAVWVSWNSLFGEPAVWPSSPPESPPPPAPPVAGGFTGTSGEVGKMLENIPPPLVPVSPLRSKRYPPVPRRKTIIATMIIFLLFIIFISVASHLYYYFYHPEENFYLRELSPNGHYPRRGFL